MEYSARRENGEWKKWFYDLPKPILGTALIYDPRDEKNCISFDNVWISKSGDSEKEFIINAHRSERDIDFNFLKDLEKTGMLHYEMVYSEYGTPLRLIFHPALLLEIRWHD